MLAASCPGISVTRVRRLLDNTDGRTILRFGFIEGDLALAGSLSASYIF